MWFPLCSLCPFLHTAYCCLRWWYWCMSFPETCEPMSIHPRLHTDKPKKQFYQCSVWSMNQQASYRYLLWENEWFKSCIIVKSLFCTGRNFMKASLMTLSPADLPPLKWSSTPQDLAKLRGWLWVLASIPGWGPGDSYSSFFQGMLAATIDITITELAA